jgi:hypothetical protein
MNVAYEHYYFVYSDDVLRSLVEQIVVCNLMSSETDEELFEDNPLDYM